MLLAVCLAASLACGFQVKVAKANPLIPRNIMLTGFWNPTGQMIANFSQNATLNPGGWQGLNWEGRGYNVYSYFPNWTNGYKGDFEVDYQKTSSDFWNFTANLTPAAIISFGAGNGPWEVEWFARNLASGWSSDGVTPAYPTPSPPDASWPSNANRYSTLPVDNIAANVTAVSGLAAFVDRVNNMGAYLCEYMGYHDMWYQSLHNVSTAPDYCAAAGFIHTTTVSSPTQAQLNQFRNATEVTLRTVIDYITGLLPPPSELSFPVIFIAGGICLACIVAPLALAHKRR